MHFLHCDRSRMPWLSAGIFVVLQKQSYIVSLLIFWANCADWLVFCVARIDGISRIRLRKNDPVYSRSIYVGNFQRSQAVLTCDRKPLGWGLGQKVNESHRRLWPFSLAFAVAQAMSARALTVLGNNNAHRSSNGKRTKCQRVWRVVCVCAFLLCWSVSGVENLGPVQQMSAETRCQQ